MKIFLKQFFKGDSMRFIFSYWCYHSPSFICRLSESLVLPNQTWILSTFWRSCHVPYSHGYSSLLPSSSRSKQNVSKEKTAMKQMWKNKNKKEIWTIFTQMSIEFESSVNKYRPSYITFYLHSNKAYEFCKPIRSG